MSKRRNPTADELIMAIKALPIKARFVEDEDNPDQKVYGLCDYHDGTLTVNEAAAIMDTLIHEAVHALRPNWSEPTVHVRSYNLFKRMSQDDLRYAFRLYQRRKKRHPKRVI